MSTTRIRKSLRLLSGNTWLRGRCGWRANCQCRRRQQATGGSYELDWERTRKLDTIRTSCIAQTTLQPIQWLRGPPHEFNRKVACAARRPSARSGSGRVCCSALLSVGHRGLGFRALGIRDSGLEILSESSGEATGVLPPPHFSSRSLEEVTRSIELLVQLFLRHDARADLLPHGFVPREKVAQV